MELSIDTSTEFASLALSFNGKIHAEFTWNIGQNHSKELLPNLAYLFHNMNVEDINAIIVALGPGSFNGLRVGVTTAKALVIALKIPIVGISTLELEAFQHSLSPYPICPVFNAGRGEIATALFSNKDGNWQRLIDDHITKLDDLLSRITGKTIFCGQLTEKLISEIENTCPNNALIAKGAGSLRRSGYLAELGWRRLQQKAFDNGATIEPIYLRRPAITTKKMN